MADRPIHRVMMLAFEDCQILDVAGPLQMLAAANRHAANGALRYEIELIAERAGAVRSNGGLSLMAARGFSDISARELRSLGTFMVAGGYGTRRALRNAALVDFVHRAGTAAPRVISVCTGSLLLAAAGLLEGKRATTHWSVTHVLREGFPEVDVKPDAIYVRDGKFWSSAGVSTGMDLAIALIEEDLGQATALAVAREHVLYMTRPGGQSQFSAELSAGAADGRSPRALRHIAANLTQDLRVPMLAEAAGMSERTLLRVFREELNTTPAEYVQRARVDAARRGLATPRAPVARIAAACGFANAEAMRRAFQRALGISPADYRARFATAQRTSH